MAGDSRLSARFGSDTTDFKNGLTEINRELKVLDSGFRASAATLGDWSHSATGLEMRIGALNKQIDLQKEKVGALSYQFDQMKAAHGENSVEAQNAEIRLNKETETLNKMQVELKQTTGDLQKMGSQAGQTGNQVQGAGKQFKALGDIVNSVKDILRNASIIAVGVGVALKKAFDLAEEGARIAQLGESWDLLTERLDAAPDILDRLSEASLRTVDTEDMMAATMKMLTGTSEGLSKSLLENAPALMEIAKASNKLNPMMGSTLELYESLSESIKNLTPRGLKQVGIVIDSAEAYEKYARSIGKVKDALTEEEQSMALLNAVLEKGQTVLEQVDGNTAAATDRFERAKISVDDLKEAIEARLLPVMGDLAEILTLALSGGGESETGKGLLSFIDKTAESSQTALEFATAYRDKLQEIYDQANLVDKIGGGFAIFLHGEEGFTRDAEGARHAILDLAASFDEYMAAAEKSLLTTRLVKKEDQLLTEAEFNQYKTLQYLIATTDFASKSYEQFLAIIENATGGMAGAEDSTGLLNDAIITMARNLYEATHASEEQTEAIESGINPLDDYNNVMKDYASILNVGTAATFKFREEQAKLNEEMEMSRVQAGISGQVKRAVESYQEGMDDLARKRQELADKMKALGATDFIPALDIKKIGQYQSQLTGLWISVHDLIQKRKEHEDFSKREQATWDETMGKVAGLEAKIKDLGGVPYLTPDQRKELEELRKEYGACDEEAKQLQEALRKATNEMIFQRAAAGLDAAATLELGRALGVISEEDYAVATVLDGLNKATASTDPGAYAAQVKAIADAIDRLHNKNIEVTVTTIQNEINNTSSGSSSHRTPTIREPGKGYARGGAGRVPPGYPDDSYPVWMTSGEEFAVTPPGSPGIASALAKVQQDLNVAVAQWNMTPNITIAGTGGAAAAGSTSITIAPGAIVINGAPGMNEEIIAQKVIDKVGDTLEIARSKGMR